MFQKLDLLKILKINKLIDLYNINEAKSCQSIVISTDSKSMNELVNENNGILIRVAQKKKLKATMGNRNIFDVDDFTPFNI